MSNAHHRHRSGERSRRRRPRRAWIVESLEGRTLLNAGDLDPTFGNGGLVTTQFADGDNVHNAYALAVQADGKIVAAGFSRNSNADTAAGFALARYGADGSLDPSFGRGGEITIGFPPGTGFHGLETARATSVVVQPDGKIVVGGYIAYGGGGFSSSSKFALARCNADGSLDPSFGQGGRVVTDFRYDAVANALALQPDGKIVEAGYSTEPSASGLDFTLVRYDTDGSLDPTFGRGGIVTTPFGSGIQSDAGADAVVVQADGKIVAAGFDFEGTGQSGFALARYNADGSLDTTFGAGGEVHPDQSGGSTHSGASSLVVQADGKIVAGGLLLYTYVGAPDSDFKLVRYNADGSLDPTFGRGGTVTTNFGPGDTGDELSALALQADGKIVAAGTTFDRATGAPADFALARYDAGGSLDLTFGQAGIVTTNFGPGQTSDGAVAVALQADGKIVAAGGTSTPTGSDFALARYEGDSTPQGNPPVAVAGGPYTIAEGQGLSLDASASSDPDGDALSFAWDVNGDGRYGDVTGATPTLSWAQLQALGVNDAGTYHVAVLVGDGHGHAVASAPATLTVTEVGPTASILDAPAGGPEGGTIHLVASVTDPSDADVQAGFREAWTITKDGRPYRSGTGTTFDFIPNDNGTYVAAFTATDKDGDSSSDRRTIIVTNVAPTATLTNDGPVAPGGTVTVRFANPSDPSAVDTAAGLHYAFATDPAALAGATYANSGPAATTTYTFAAAGSYTVYGRVIDKDGGYTQYSTVIDVASPGDVTSQVHIAQSGFTYNRLTGQFLQTFTVTNTSGNPLGAPMLLVLEDLTPGVTLADATGTTADGSPEILLPLGSSNVLAPNQSVTVSLVFADPSHVQIGYTPHVLSTPVAATDITSQATIKLGGFTYDRATSHFLESVTITNASNSAFVGPVAFVLDGLPSGVSLLNPSGTTSRTTPAGSPYVLLNLPNGALQPGQSVTIILTFVDPSKVAITFKPRLLEGPGEF